jgi:hypothetical protein
LAQRGVVPQGDDQHAEMTEHLDDASVAASASESSILDCHQFHQFWTGMK